MRSRFRYASLVLITIVCGLASRRPGWPEWVYLYVGDALYATMFYFLLATFFPARRAPILAGLSLGWCWSVELSQAVHWPWLDWLRDTRVGGLVLGHGFLWSDMVCYVVGVGLGLGVDRISADRPSLQGALDSR